MTATDICNLALSYIGKGSIIDMQDQNETARQTRLHYEATKELLLRQYEWNFAKRQIKLAPIECEIHGFAYAYMYPEDAIRVIAVLPQGQRYDPFREEEYEVYNVDNNTKAILTNVPNASVMYIYDITDCDLFDSLFVEALARKLAANLAMSLLGNANMVDMQYKMYQAALAEAKNLSAKERNGRLEYPCGYALARGE